MRLLITGSREYGSPGRVWDTLESALAFCETVGDTLTVVVGDCPTGADLYARDFCEAHQVHCSVGVAHWDAFGKRAGPMRNRAMAQRVARVAPIETVACVAFFEPGAGNRGTQDCVDAALASGLIVHEIHG